MYAECIDLAGHPSPVEESGRDERVGAAHRRRGGAGHPGLRARPTAGASPSPALVKQILTSTADDIQAPGRRAGVRPARRLPGRAGGRGVPGPGRHAGTPDTLLESTSQFNAAAGRGHGRELHRAADQPGVDAGDGGGLQPDARRLHARQHGHGDPERHGQPAQRRLPGDHRQLRGGDLQRAHRGGPAERLDRLPGGLECPAGPGPDGPDHPSGQLADYSVPQGVGNYGDAQVADPAPGKWTAYIWSRDSADGGTTGPVLFGASVASYQPFGTVSPPR